MKAKITKGFKHLGRWLNAGDEIDEEPAVIAALVDQGYAEAEDQPADKPAAAQQSAQSAPGNQQHQSEPAPEYKRHKGRE